MPQKLRLIIAAIIVFIALPAIASGGSGDDTPHFGVRAQYDIAKSTTYSDVVKSGPGFSAGFIYYAPFGRLTYFNSALMFSYTDFGYRGTQENASGPVSVDGHLTTCGLKLPLEIGVKLYQTENVKLSLYTGPQLNFIFSLHGKFTSTRNDETEDIDKDYKTSGMDISWNLGAAIDIRRHWHVYLQGSYGLSNLGMIDDLLDNELAHLKRAELSVGIGYNF